MQQSVFHAEAGQRFREFGRFIGRDGRRLIMACLFLEFLLRFAAPSYINQLFDQEYTAGHPIALNSAGYRGEAVSQEKPAGAYRALALGDSVTFGTGVAAEDTWPRQLDRILPSPSSVINASMAGASLAELTFAFDQRWAAYEPDVVVLAASDNMVALSWIRRNEPARMPETGYRLPGESDERQPLVTQLRRFAYRFATPRFLRINSQRLLYWAGLAGHTADPATPYGPWLALGWQQANLDAEISTEAWDQFEQDLEDLRDRVAHARCPLYVTHVPVRFQLTDQFWDNEKLVPKQQITIDSAARTREICRRKSIPYIDAASALRGAREQRPFASLYIQFDYFHLDPKGHRALAQAIARELLQDPSQRP